LKDATHAASMTKIFVREMGIRVNCVGTYCKHDGEWFKELQLMALAFAALEKPQGTPCRASLYDQQIILLLNFYEKKTSGFWDFYICCQECRTYHSNYQSHIRCNLLLG